MARGETVLHFPGTVTGRDAKGNDVVEYPDDGVEIDGCPVWPLFGSTEDTEHRDTVVSGMAVVVPACTCVDPIDRFEVRGRMYEVDGEPQDWRSPFTRRRPGLEVHLTRVTG